MTGERMHIVVICLFVFSLVTTIDQIAATTTSKYNLHVQPAFKYEESLAKLLYTYVAVTFCHYQWQLCGRASLYVF